MKFKSGEMKRIASFMVIFGVLYSELLVFLLLLVCFLCVRPIFMQIYGKKAHYRTYRRVFLPLERVREAPVDQECDAWEINRR